MTKVGDGLSLLDLENGAMYMLKCILQRPKEMVLEGLVKLMVELRLVRVEEEEED